MLRRSVDRDVPVTLRRAVHGHDETDRNRKKASLRILAPENRLGRPLAADTSSSSA
jgi:hypothetical protein